ARSTHSFGLPTEEKVPAKVHFDEAEAWSDELPPFGIDLMTVAVHEFGHALGLDRAPPEHAGYGDGRVSHDVPCLIDKRQPVALDEATARGADSGSRANPSQQPNRRRLDAERTSTARKVRCVYPAGVGDSRSHRS